MAPRSNVDWSNLEADYARLGSAYKVAELYGVARQTVDWHLARLRNGQPGDRGAREVKGINTSIHLPWWMVETRDTVREHTGYPDSVIYRMGLMLAEAGLDRAFENGNDPDYQCDHTDRYPNGYCKGCYRRPRSWNEDVAAAG